MPKLVGGAEDYLPEDGVKPESKARTALVAKLWFESDSGSLTSTRALRTLCPVFRIMLLVFLVLNQVILFAAAADDLGWWPSESDSLL